MLNLVSIQTINPLRQEKVQSRTPSAYQRIATEEAFASPEVLDIYRKMIDKSYGVEKSIPGFKGLMGFYMSSPSARAQHTYTGHRCTGVEQDANGATVYFAYPITGDEMSSVKADVVVACDGINSAIRK